MIKTVRIIHHSTFRGQVTGTKTALVPAILLISQEDGTVVVELMEAVFGFKKGHNIAVYPQNIIQ